MNQKERKAFIRREIAELNTHEQLFRQSLSSIASRKRYLTEELIALGGINSASRGSKYSNVLSETAILKLQGSITK